MATNQRFTTSGSRRLKRRQLSELRARQQMLPSILAAEQSAELQEKEEKFRNKQLAQQKSQAIDTLKFRERESEKATGLAAGKFGAGLLMRESLPFFGKTNFGKRTTPTTSPSCGWSPGTPPRTSPRACA